MEQLWTQDRPQSVRSVLLGLQQDRALAYTTVMTVMERLYRKGLLQRTEDGRAYLYTTTLSRAGHTAQLMERALTGTQDRTAALVHFADRIGPEEARTLLEALAGRSLAGPQT